MTDRYIIIGIYQPYQLTLCAHQWCTSTHTLYSNKAFMWKSLPHIYTRKVLHFMKTYMVLLTVILTHYIFIHGKTFKVMIKPPNPWKFSPSKLFSYTQNFTVMNVYYVIEYFRPIHKFSETLIRPPAWYTHETTAGREVYIVDGRFSQTQSHINYWYISTIPTHSVCTSACIYYYISYA